MLPLLQFAPVCREVLLPRENFPAEVALVHVPVVFGTGMLVHVRRIVLGAANGNAWYDEYVLSQPTATHDTTNMSYHSQRQRTVHDPVMN